MSTQNYSILQQAILKRRTIATSIGSATGDMFIGPIAEALMDRTDTLNEFVIRMQSLNSITSIVTDTAFFSNLVTALESTPQDVQNGISQYINSISSQYGLFRKPATSATGFVTFARSSAPTSDITIPAGTVVYSSTTTQQYITTQTVVMTVANNSSFFNPNTLLYEIQAPVTAQAGGSSGNIASNLIDSTKSSLSNITTIYNALGLTNGIDAETDSALIARVLLALPGHNFGTTSGYKLFILSNTSIANCYVAGQGDPLMKRDFGGGGSVDIYIQQRDLTQVQDPPTSLTTYQLKQQPAVNIVSVTDSLGAASNYTFFPDINSFYSGSVQAQSFITISSGVAPYVVVYQIDNNVITTQALIDSPENTFVGSDVLIKEATAVNVDIAVTLSISPSFVASAVIADVVTAVTAYVNSLTLGQPLQEFNVILTIGSVSGVLDAVVTQLNHTGVAGVIDTVTTTGTQFITLNKITAVVG